MRGLKEVSREDLFAVPIPTRTQTYVPISNEKLIRSAESIVQDFGYTIEREEYQVTRSGRVMIGKWYLGTDHSEVGKMLALGNSYDKSRSIAIAAGANVFACTNGMFKGEYLSKRKHVGNIIQNLEEVIRTVVGAVENNYRTLIQDMETMKRLRLDRTTTAQLLGDMYFNHKIMNATQLGIIKKELDFSKNFRMVEPGEFTMWNLYNNVTEALKTTHPVNYIAAHRNLHTYVTNHIMNLMADIHVAAVEEQFEEVFEEDEA